MGVCVKSDIDCTNCVENGDSLFVLHQYPIKTHFPAEKYTHNVILIVLKGELLVNSQEYPGMIVTENHLILQAIGSKVELLALTDVEYIAFHFTEIPLLCPERYREILRLTEEPVVYTPLPLVTKLERMVTELADYLGTHPTPCHPYLKLKGQELIYLLTTCYPLPIISPFFYPISTYTESFQYFVMRNYDKVKNTEEFAHLGGYTLTTFRRLFKNLYGVPVYVWMLNKKREGILNDLLHGKERIGVISTRYGFESMSHFAHFCKDSFGDTPRALRKRAAAGEKIVMLNRSSDNEDEDEKVNEDKVS